MIFDSLYDCLPDLDAYKYMCDFKIVICLNCWMCLAISFLVVDVTNDRDKGAHPSIPGLFEWNVF